MSDIFDMTCDKCGESVEVSNNLAYLGPLDPEDTSCSIAIELVCFCNECCPSQYRLKE